MSADIPSPDEVPLPSYVGMTDGPVRPVALAVAVDDIPPALKRLDRWVSWRYQWEEVTGAAKGNWKKPPHSPISGKPASVTNPATWASFETAASCLKVQGVDGIGLVLDGSRDAGTGLPLCCLDLDDCRDPHTGAVRSDARTMAEMLASYTEVSASGRGLHVWFYADLLKAGMRQSGREIYCAGRYIAVTGVRASDPFPKPMCRQKEASLLLARYFSAPTPSRPSVAPVPRVSLADDEVVRRCSSGPGGETFKRLLAGEDCVADNTSDSDLSFCARLAFYCADPAQIVRIWRYSSRWREKCERQIASDNPLTYAEATAHKADSSQVRYYDPAFRSGKPVNGRAGTATANAKGDGPTQTPPPPTVSVTPPVSPGKSLANTKAAETHTGGGGVLHRSSPNRKVRRASDIADEDIVYFVEPLIPKGELSFVIGHPGTGKSTFLAWLASHCQRAVIFPGFEGSVGRMYKPRLLAHGCNVRNIYFFEEHGWTMPSSLAAIIAEVQDVGADLVMIDPIDSYMDDGVSENSTDGVRPALEAWQKVAEVTGAAVVGVRHPGKASDNPLPGSRAWRAVPRRILELRFDSSAKPRSFVHIYKSGTGEPPPDMYYRLAFSDKGKPPVFTLQEPVSSSEAELSRNAGDRDERRALDVAVQYLLAALSDGEKEAGPLCKKAAEVGVASRTLYRALERIGGEKKVDGFGANIKHVWFIPPTLPAQPDDPAKSAP